MCPKKNGKYTIILDLSRPEGESVNDFIDIDNYPLFFCNIDDAVKLVTRADIGAIMAKLDIQNAFRLVPVRLADWHLLGIFCEGQYYYDVDYLLAVGHPRTYSVSSLKP